MVHFLQQFKSFRSKPHTPIPVAATWSPAGQSGLGKSTMVNTLFKSKMWKSTLPGLGGPTPQTLQLHSITHVE